MFHINYNKIMSKNVLEQDPSEEHPILRSQSAIPEENFQISDSSIQRSFKSYNHLHSRSKGIAKKFWQILLHRSNKYVKDYNESYSKQKNAEGFTHDVPLINQQCYSYLSQAIANSRNLKKLDISGTDILPILAIELGNGIKNNSTLIDLNLSACRLNSFSLQHLFTSVSNHKTLQHINLFNNQGFQRDLMIDMRDYLLRGNNKIKSVKLTHCNIDSTSLSYFFRNLNKINRLSSIDVSMMHFNAEVLTSLGIGLQHFKGSRFLESLNLAGCYIKNEGLRTIWERFNWNFRHIKIHNLNLSSNRFHQKGIYYLQKWLSKINGLQRLDLSSNELEEFDCNILLSKPLYQVNLGKNKFKQFPNNFFLHALVIDLSHNKITSEGAFQLSSILRQQPSWIELNLSNNQIQSEGFNALIFGLRDNTMLKKLLVANTGLDGESIICYMINHEQISLEYLDISWNTIRYSIIFLFLNYLKHGRMRVLRASYIQDDLTVKDEISSSIMDKSLVAKTQFSDDNNMAKSVYRKGKKNTSAVFQIMAQNLRELDFHGNNAILSPVINSLSTYFNKIELLNISNCKIEGLEDIESLSIFISKTISLHDLNISGLKLGLQSKNIFNTFVKGLGQNQSIIRLNLSNNSLNNYFKLFVEEGMRSYNLECLDLSFNLIDSEQAEYLEILVLQVRNLHDLNLAGNAIGYHGLNAIVKGIKRNKRLRSLNLSHQKFLCDDLLMIAELISQAENLQNLNISNNLTFYKTGTVYHRCSQQKQQTQIVKDTHFDVFNTMNVRKSFQRQRKCLRNITLDSCTFSQGCFTLISSVMSILENLEYLHIVNNSTIDKELVSITDSIQKLSRLQVLQISSTVLTPIFMIKFCKWLSDKRCKLQVLDLSKNYFRQEQLDQLAIGIQNNKSLKSLNLASTGLGSMNLGKLGQCLYLNDMLRNLNLSHNRLVSVSFLKSTHPDSFWLSLNLSGNKQINTLEPLFVPSDSPSNRISSQLQGVRVKCLDMAECGSTIQNFEEINRSLSRNDNHSFKHVHILNIQNNQLEDSFASTLGQIIERLGFLLDLNVSHNNFTNEGASIIYTSMIVNQSIKVLNLSFNKIGDPFILGVSDSLLENKLENLEFMMLDGNLIEQEGTQEMIKILSYQTELFITQQWKGLNDEQAIRVIKMYKRLKEKYRMVDHLPDTLTNIQIIDSFLTDEFCKEFCNYYHFLDFVKLIDFSDNPQISYYGKVYLFIHIFDSKFDGHKLHHFYISESVEARKLFDEGILKFFLFSMRDYLCPQPRNVFVQDIAVNRFKKRRSQMRIAPITGFQVMVGGLCGEWVLHKINQVLSLLDEYEPPSLLLSQQINQSIRVGFRLLKISNILTFCLNVMIILFSTYTMWGFDIKAKWNEANDLYKKLCIDQTCGDFEGVSPSIDPQTILGFLSIIAMIGVLELISVIYNRRQTKTIFQIMTPQLISYLRKKIPHLTEILCLFLGICLRVSSVLDFHVLALVLLLGNHQPLVGHHHDSDFEVIQALFVLILSVKFFIWFSVGLKALYDQHFTSFANIPEFLAINLKLNFINFNIIRARFNLHVSPAEGIKVGMQKIHFLSYYELINLSTSSVPFLVLYFIIYGRYLHFIHTEYGSKDIFYHCNELLQVCILKEVARSMFAVFVVLVVRPTVVKQHEFNQALVIRRHQYNKINFIDKNTFNFESSLKQQEKIKQILRSFQDGMNEPRINPISERDDEVDDDEAVGEFSLCQEFENDEKERFNQQVQLYTNHHLMSQPSISSMSDSGFNDQVMNIPAPFHFKSPGV